MFDVVTFGSAVIDMFVETDMREKGKFMEYPVGSKILVNNMKFEIGGGGTNTAVAFARLGLKTGYIEKIGNDFSGKEILGMLKKEKIAFLGKIEGDEKILGGYSVILDSRDHDRTILTYKGVNDDVSYSDLRVGRIRTKWLYFSSLLGESLKTQARLAKELHARGTKIAFNPSEYLIKSERKNISGILRICEVVILNKEEAELLLGRKAKKTQELLSGLVDLGSRIAVITDRDREVVAFDGNNKYSIIPHKVKVVERTGAGDAFASGFVAGLVTGKSTEESMKLGLEEGEAVIRGMGAKTNLIRRRLR